MLKQDFIKKVSEMNNPVLEEFSPDDGDLLSTCWVVWDKANLQN